MLDPQCKKIIDLVAEKGIPPTHTLTPVAARESYAQRRFFAQNDPAEVAQVRDLKIPGPGGDLTLRSYRPLGSTANQVLPCLVYYHGGGHVIGDLDTHDVLCRDLSNLAQCAVFLGSRLFGHSYVVGTSTLALTFLALSVGLIGAFLGSLFLGVGIRYYFFDVLKNAK